MSKKAFLIILVLSVVVTYGVAFTGFATGIYKLSSGFPFGFTNFNFLGAETDFGMLIGNIFFWFFVIWIIWWGFKKLINK